METITVVDTVNELLSIDWEVDGIEQVLMYNALDSNSDYNDAFYHVKFRLEQYNRVVITDEAFDYLRDNFLSYYYTGEC